MPLLSCTLKPCLLDTAGVQDGVGHPCAQRPAGLNMTFVLVQGIDGGVSCQRAQPQPSAAIVL